jgi:hypothetical protein
MGGRRMRHDKQYNHLIDIITIFFLGSLFSIISILVAWMIRVVIFGLIPNLLVLKSITWAGIYLLLSALLARYLIGSALLNETVKASIWAFPITSIFLVSGVLLFNAPLLVYLINIVLFLVILIMLYQIDASWQMYFSSTYVSIIMIYLNAIGLSI